MNSVSLTEFCQVPGLLPDTNLRYLLNLLICQTDVLEESEFPCVADRDEWLFNLIESGKSDPRIRDLLPFAYQRLTERGIEVNNLAYLQSLRMAFAGRNHQQGSAWRDVVQRLQSAGIQPVLLKGNSLIADYYDDPTLRPMTDADILVTIEDQSQANEVLQTLGWSKLSMTYDSTDPTFEHATPYTRLAKEWSDIDLHVHVLSKCHSPEIDHWFLNNIEAFEFYGIQAYRLNPTALLTHLLLHGLRYSAKTPIRWIVDCQFVLQKRPNEINWQEMLAFVEQHQFTLRISLALLYLHDEFGASLPAVVVDTLRRHRPGYFERMETTFLLKPFPSNASLPKRSIHLVTLVTWRASRMRGGWFLPLDVLRVVRHMISGRSLSTAFIRAWRYGKNN